MTKLRTATELNKPHLMTWETTLPLIIPALFLFCFAAYLYLVAKVIQEFLNAPVVTPLLLTKGIGLRYVLKLKPSRKAIAYIRFKILGKR